VNEIQKALKTNRNITQFAVIVGIGLTMAALISVTAGSGWFTLLVALLSVIGSGLLLVCYLVVDARIPDLTPLQIPFMLARDADVYPSYEEVSHSLLQMSQNSDPIFRDSALNRLALLESELAELAEGTVKFDGTETWRLAYEQLLKSPGLHLYRSVAWVRNENYWQNAAGRQSFKLNLELKGRDRLTIERIVILADDLWPSDLDLPTDRVKQWLHKQHTEGIQIALVRESALHQEPDLLKDMGIYGSRAVGWQEFDENSQPFRFVIKFNFNEVTTAEERWSRLKVYSTNYQDFLDHLPLTE